MKPRDATPADREGASAVRVGLFASAAVLIGAYWSLTAAVADTLFLSRLAAEGHAVVPWLASVYVLVAAGGVLGTWSFSAAQLRLERRIVVVAAPVALGVAFIALRQLLTIDAAAVRLALAVLADVGGLLSMMVFFSVVGDHFSTRDGKRLYGRIGAGLPVGVLIGGAAVAPLGARLGLANVLYISSCLLLLTAAVFAAATARPTSVAEPSADGVDDTGPGSPAVRQYARWLARLSFLTPVLFVCADLPMKWFVSSLPPAAMSHFFGAFYAAVGVSELVMQLVLVRFLMSGLGMNRALMLFPALVGGACAVLVAAPTLLVATVASFLRAVIGETIESQARELHWLSLPARLRHRLQPWATGALAPVGQGVAGLGLAALATLGMYRAAPIAGLATAVLIVLVVRRLGPLHLVVLTDALRYRLPDEHAMGRLLRAPGMRALTRSLLASSDPAIAGVTRDLLASADDRGPPPAADMDPDRVGIVAAAEAARSLVARGGEPPSDLAERIRRSLDRMEVVYEARGEADAFVAPFLDDHLRMRWDHLLSLCALQIHRGQANAVESARRNLWTSSHSAALDLLDTILPPAVAARAIRLAALRVGTGSGLSLDTRDRLAACDPWLRKLALYGAGGAHDRTIDEIARLRALPLFAGVAADLLVPIAQGSRTVDVASGDVLLEEASAPDGAYIILEGEVTLSSAGSTIATVGAGESVGEMGVLDGEPRSARAVAAAPSRVLFVPDEVLRTALMSHSALVEALLRTLAARLRATQGQEPWDGVAGSSSAADWDDRQTGIAPVIARTAFLREVPLFRGVSTGYAAAVARLAKPVDSVAGTLLFAAGQPGDAFYVVERGRLGVQVGDRRVATLGAGDFVGEMALLDGAPRSATVVVDESGSLLCIAASDFASLIATTPAIGMELLRALATRLRAATRDARRARESSIGRA